MALVVNGRRRSRRNQQTDCPDTSCSGGTLCACLCQLCSVCHRDNDLVMNCAAEHKAADLQDDWLLSKSTPDTFLCSYLGSFHRCTMTGSEESFFFSSYRIGTLCLDHKSRGNRAVYRRMSR